MPCSCWYDPPAASKKLIKDSCKIIIDEVKRLEERGDPSECTLWDVIKLLRHLYNPDECNERPRND